MSTAPKENRPKSRQGKRRWSALAPVALIIFIVIIIGAGLGFLTASIHTAPGLKGEIRPAASLPDLRHKRKTCLHNSRSREPCSSYYQ